MKLVQYPAAIANPADLLRIAARFRSTVNMCSLPVLCRLLAMADESIEESAMSSHLLLWLIVYQPLLRSV